MSQFVARTPPKLAQTQGAVLDNEAGWAFRDEHRRVQLRAVRERAMQGGQFAVPGPGGTYTPTNRFFYFT